MALYIDDEKKSTSDHIDKNCIKIVSGLEHRSEKIYGPYDIFDLDLHPKYTKMNAYSGDVSLQIEILWTFKKEEMKFGPSFSLRVPPKIWRSEKLDIVTRYFYIRILRSTMQASSEGSVANDLLYFELRSTKKKNTLKKDDLAQAGEDVQHPLSSEVKSPLKLQIPSVLQLELPPVETKNSGSSPLVEEEKSSSEMQQRSSSPFGRRMSTAKGGFFSSKDKKKPYTFGSVTTTVPVFDSRLPTFIPDGALLVGGKNGRIELIPKAHCGGLSLLANADGRAEWSMVYPPKL
jgi:hypothetical protein